MGLVTLSYDDLIAGKDLTADVLRAYGPDGLGALTVSGIPEYVELREKLLRLSYTLAHLPEVCFHCRACVICWWWSSGWCGMCEPFPEPAVLVLRLVLWAILLQDERKKLEHEPSMYNVGWSHGKEKLGDTPDFAKGSFYGNPLYDEPGTPVTNASGQCPCL